MEIMDEHFQKYFISFAYLAGGFLFGVFIEKIFLKHVRNVTLKTKWRGDNLVVDSLQGLVGLFGMLGGSYFAFRHWPNTALFIQPSEKILISALCLLTTIWGARILVGIIKLRTSRLSGLLPTSSIIANIARITVYIIGAVAIFHTLGIPIAPLITALGVGGVAIALALQDTLSNLFSGIQVIASRQIRAGDFVKLSSGEEGYITDITWRNTTVRMLSNNLVVVPNAKVASAILVNYYLPDKETAVLIEVSVSYDSDLEKVEQVTIASAAEIIKNTPGAVESFEPFIRYHTFADSGIAFTVILRAKEFTDQYLIKHEFVKTLLKQFKKHGIEIPYPVRTILFKNSDLKEHS